MPPSPSTQPLGRCWQALVAACACLLSCQTLSAQRGEDIGSIYLNAYMMADEAKGLEGQGRHGDALRKYNDASNILNTIARNHPGWRSEVVTYRRRKVNEAIARVQVNVPGFKQGVPKGHGTPPAETYIPPPSVGGADTSSTVLSRKDAEIQKLKSTTEDLLRRLQLSQGDLAKTTQDLNVSRSAQDTLKVQLGKAQRMLADSAGDSATAKKMEGEVKRLANELDIANESLAAANRRNEKLQQDIAQAKDAMESLKTERSELQKEREQFDEMLKGAADSDVKKLLVENQNLKKELAGALADAKRLTGEKEKDAATIADLQGRLAKVEGRLAQLQDENAAYRERIESLSTKLRDTRSSLEQALQGPSGQASIAQAAMEENEALRSIVEKQITQQEWRKQAKDLVLEQIASTGNLSQDIMRKIEELAGNGAALTPAEMAVVRGSLLPEGSDGVIMDAGSTAAAPVYPALLGHNDGTRSASGLNENLTQFAEAIVADFARGNLAACEGGYSQILEIAPGNVYAMRNLGIVKMRLGKNSEAESLLRQAIATDSGDGYSHFLLGVVHYRADDYKSAMAAMDRGLQIDPDNARAHHYVGAMCIERAAAQDVPEALRQDMRELARQEFENVISIDPNFGDAYYNLAYLFVTDQTPRLDLARQFYHKAQQNGTPSDAAMDRALGT